MVGKSVVNWSGYVHGGLYTSVTGTFIVPRVAAGQDNIQPAAASEWVGLDGVTRTGLIQAGVTEVLPGTGEPNATPAGGAKAAPTESIKALGDYTPSVQFTNLHTVGGDKSIAAVLVFQKTGPRSRTPSVYATVGFTVAYGPLCRPLHDAARVVRLQLVEPGRALTIPGRTVYQCRVRRGNIYEQPEGRWDFDGVHRQAFCHVPPSEVTVHGQPSRRR